MNRISVYQHSRISAFAALVLLAGCETMTEYRKPAQPTPAPTAPPPIDGPVYSGNDGASSAGGSSAEIFAPRTTVWRNLLNGAPRSGFVVQSANDKAGTVSIRIVGDPLAYVDCGRVISTVRGPQGEKRYEFPAAIGQQNYELMRGERIFQVDRKMALDAIATVKLDPVAKSRTRARVDVRYALTRDQAVGGGEKPMKMTDSISFITGSAATFPNAATTCRPTGRLERELLAIAAGTSKGT